MRVKPSSSWMQLLAARFAAARAADDDAAGGVYAVPGPRAQGDEALSSPPLSAELLDEVRISKLPDLPAQPSAVRVVVRSGRDHGDEGGGGDEGAN